MTVNPLPKFARANSGVVLSVTVSFIQGLDFYLKQFKLKVAFHVTFGSYLWKKPAF